jgi:hypothetical protein
LVSAPLSQHNIDQARTSDVAQKLLGASRSEFRDPVVLTSGSRCHRGHLSHRGNRSEETNKGTQIRPYQTGKTSIDKSKGARAELSLVSLSNPIHVNCIYRDNLRQLGLPGTHQDTSEAEN